MEYLKRIINPSLNLISGLTKDKQFEFVSQNHHLNGREIYVSKKKNQFHFETTSEIIKGIQTHKELEFIRNDEYELKNEYESIFVKGKDILLNNIAYSESFQSKILSGAIYSYSDKKSTDKETNLFRRFIIPLESDKIGLTDFERRLMETESIRSFYLPVFINDKEYYLYERKHEDNNYLFIDSSHSLKINDFQKICFNILLSMAFIKGNLFHNECYILSFDSNEMNTPIEKDYFSMRTTVITNLPTFTTNMYSIYSDIIEYDDNHKIKPHFENNFLKDVDNFPIQQFSKLAETIYKEEKVQRALLLFVYGHNSSLEMRLPNYFVALEALTAFIVKSQKNKKQNLHPIKSSKKANDIQGKIIEMLKTYKEKEKLDDKDFNIEILTKKIETLNSPPNADKLSESFTLIDYNLSPEQKKILKNRNSFLHGSFVRYVDSEDAFSEALYISLRVHFLIAVLVLKIVGFTGKIINYCSLWENITGKTVNENRMIKI